MIGTYFYKTKDLLIGLTILIFIAIIAGSSLSILKYVMTPPPISPHKDLARAIGSFDEVSALLRPSLINYNASRVTVFRLHPDSEYGTDISSMTTFSVSVANIIAQPGIPVDMPSLTNIPASVFVSVLPHLIDNHPVMIYTRDLPTSPLKELSEHRNTVASFFTNVNDATGNIIAMLSLSWTSEQNIPKGDKYEQMVKDVQAQARCVSKFFGLLPLREYKH